MPDIRLFIAIETPADIRAQIAQIQGRLRESGADVRWEPEEKLHATLKFLGNTPDEKVQPVADALELVSRQHTRCTITYTNLGCFPTSRSPRVVWIGIEDPSEALRALFLDIEESMASLGFERETRPFHPHLTLGRVKGSRNLGRLLAMLKTVTFQSQPVIVPEIALVRSDLRPSGSVYTTLKAIPLMT